MRLNAFSLNTVTILCIDIKGFTAGCAAMDAQRVGEWVADFYERVGKAAVAHGVSKVEARGDCCICLSGAEGAVPSPLFADAAADAAHDQATRFTPRAPPFPRIPRPRPDAYRHAHVSADVCSQHARRFPEHVPARWRPRSPPWRAAACALRPTPQRCLRCAARSRALLRTYRRG
jgi:class 3 adenylate cyclase